MAIEVFNRYEIKYLLDTETYEKVTEAVLKHMRPDKYCRNGAYYSICNIYYDTQTDEIIRKSISKPIYKEKLRLRSYGKPDGSSEAFVEIKKKFKKTVNKRRTTMTLDEAVAYLDKDIRPEGDNLNKQVLAEIDYFKQFYQVMPKVYISYDRRAYFGIDDDSFRITFDNNIQARREDLDLTKGAYGKQLLPPGKWLMEAKISGGTPYWFTKLLSELKLYPVSFSKYGTEYRMHLKEQIENKEKK